MDWLDALQWPAMAVTLLASWLVASKREALRAWGFWVFLASNALWIAWGWHSQAWALVALQAGLVAMNVRGAAKNEVGRERVRRGNVLRQLEPTTHAHRPAPGQPSREHEETP